jgi:hypothetical protein
MIDQATLNALLVALGSSITGLVGMFIYIMRTGADARNQNSRDTTKAHNTQQTTATDAIANTLGALVGLLTKAIDNLDESNKIASKERAETTLVLREMMGYINGVLSAQKLQVDKTQGLILSFNDLEGGFLAARDVLKKVEATTDTLQTDIVGEMSVQFGPVVDALKGINNQLESLSRKVTEKDADTAASFGRLIESVGKLEVTLLKALEPIVIQQFRIGDIPNGQDSLHPPVP